MEKFTVEIYAIEWCGFSEYYEVIAEDESDAEDIAIEKHLEDFVDMYGLLHCEDGKYLEDEDDDDEPTDIAARTIT